MANPLWDKFKPASGLNNYMSDVVEIGYSQYGMTLAVSGTMTSTGKFTIILNMHVDLINKKARHMFVFDWLAFRPIQFNDDGFKGADIKMASKFLVTADQPYKYNIVFADQTQYSTISPIFKQILSEWEKSLQDNAKTSAYKDVTSLFQDFIQRESIVRAQEELKKNCYWIPETYTLRLAMMGKNNTKIREDEKIFSLTADHLKKLESNPTAIIADICKQPAVSYVFLKIPFNTAD